MPKLICFDLEGPLSPQDNAYEVMRLIPEGHRIFEFVSRYDDLLTLEGKEDYEPGDTLKLIVPFLIYHNLTESHIRQISEKALIVQGAEELIDKLKTAGWHTYIISTSYQQHAHYIGGQLGVPPEDTICTHFPLDQYHQKFAGADFSLIEQVEKELLNIYPTKDDQLIKNCLDKFFWQELPKTDLGEIFEAMRVIGGERKVDAARGIAAKNQTQLAEMVTVGDSITDFKLLKEIDQAGGLAIVFNGNEYAVPYGTVGVASISLLDLWPIIKPWPTGGREAVKEVIQDKPNCHWLKGLTDFRGIIKIHKEYRQRVRGEPTAKLG